MPEQINDEFSHIPNKIIRWRMRKRRDKKCRNCGKPVGLDGTLTMCAKHAAMHRDEMNRKNGRRRTLRGSKYDSPA